MFCASADKRLPCTSLSRQSPILLRKYDLDRRKRSVMLSITHKLSSKDAAKLESMRRVIPRHVTVFPGGGSLACAR